jgi:RHS repeat-associated protein
MWNKPASWLKGISTANWRHRVLTDGLIGWLYNQVMDGTSTQETSTTPTVYQIPPQTRVCGMALCGWKPPADSGQRNESGIGLYYYNARWYDASLGRFAQADTIIPGGVQGLDRYAYANNSPVKYSDPSGHCVGAGGHDFPDGHPACSYGGSSSTESTILLVPFCRYMGQCNGNEIPTSWLDYILGSYGIKLGGDPDGWTNETKLAICIAVLMIGAKLAEGTLMTAAEAFSKVFGTMQINWGKEGASGPICPNVGSGGCTSSSRQINFWSMSGGDKDYYPDIMRMVKNVVHEFGHAYNNKFGGALANALDLTVIPSHRANILLSNPEVDGHVLADWQQNTSQNGSETFADMFVAWTFDAWNEDPLNTDHYLVDAAQTFMNNVMP